MTNALKMELRRIDRNTIFMSEEERNWRKTLRKNKKLRKKHVWG